MSFLTRLKHNHDKPNLVRRGFHSLLLIAGFALPTNALAAHNDWVNPDNPQTSSRYQNSKSHKHNDHKHGSRDRYTDVTRIYLKSSLPGHFRQQLMGSVKQRLPGPVRWVKNKHKADLILTVREKHYDFERQKLYKTTEKARYSSHRFRAAKAKYDVITERLTAHYRYRLALKAPHSGHERAVWTLSGHASRDHTYARNLRIRYPHEHGWHKTDAAPNRHVAYLLKQNRPKARKFVAHELRHDVIAQLSRKISRKTKRYMAQNGLQHRPHYTTYNYRDYMNWDYGRAR